MALQEVESSGLCESLRAAVDAQLAVDVASMDFHRARAQNQVPSDLAIGKPLSNQAQHL